MTAMNGIAKVIAPWFQPATSDKLISIHANGSQNFILLAGPVIFRVPQDIPPRETSGKAELWIDLATKDISVANALRIFGSRPATWANLYNLYEIMKEDTGGWKMIVANGWAEKSELDRFRNTANDPTITGDDARHQKAYDKPAWNVSFQPMPHDEARLLLSRLLHNWLESRLTLMN